MSGLTPACGEREANADKGEAHHHVPSADVGDWILGLGDVEDHNPEETDKESANHCGSEPSWAL
jgi:hypothetical protein